MKKTKYKTLITVRVSNGFIEELKLEEVEGYFIFVDDHRFFAYQSETKRWYVVDPEVGISFVSANSLSDAKEEMRLKIKNYEEFICTDEYRKMQADYENLNNSDVLPGQMSIYDLWEGGNLWLMH